MKNYFKTLLLVIAISSYAFEGFSQRKTISLNGKWAVEETNSASSKPTAYHHTIIVPSLIDMAQPKFKEIVKKADSLRYFWYKKSFTLNAPLPKNVVLEIKKAMYGKQIFVNGKYVGIHYNAFTSFQKNIREYLNKAGEPNELVVRLGTFDNFPDTLINGTDFEKTKFFPGIYDDVNLLLSNGPFIQNIQIAPDITKKTIKVVAIINSNGQKGTSKINYSINEWLSKKQVSGGEITHNFTGGIDTVKFESPVSNCSLWSPEHPFLYVLKTSTGQDNQVTRFGMRSFRFGRFTKTALLNNEKYYLRGTNVPVYRFFEDSLRKNLPWNEKWVRLMFSRFKEMHWNIVRFHVGPAPQFWYDIADEMGMLIQDEYAIWGGKGGIRKSVTADHIALEYTEWMQDRWNHPSIVIWDGQNETVATQTALAINKVRHLDLSNRPWDNGYSAPASENDPIEAHPYLFYPYHMKDAKEPEEGLLKHLLGTRRIPSNDPNEQDPAADGHHYNNAIILNEYAWLWVNRDGSATTLSENVYKNFFKDVVTNQQRIEKCARLTAALTEYWRAYRTSAAVMYFAGLSYSRPHPPRGETSDLLQNLETFTYWPAFTKYIKSAFSPVGLMVDAWEKLYQPAAIITVPVHVINDLKKPWKGQLEVDITKNNRIISHQVLPASAASFEVKIHNFKVKLPSAKGEYILTARLFNNGEKIESLRDISVK